MKANHLTVVGKIMVTRVGAAIKKLAIVMLVIAEKLAIAVLVFAENLAIAVLVLAKKLVIVKSTMETLLLVILIAEMTKLDGVTIDAVWNIAHTMVAKIGMAHTKENMVLDNIVGIAGTVETVRNIVDNIVDSVGNIVGNVGVDTRMVVILVRIVESNLGFGLV